MRGIYHRWSVAVVVLAIAIVAAPATAQNLLGDVQAERAKYGASMTPSEVAAMLNAVAWKHRDQGWGLLRKGSGNSCPLGSTFISCDILIDSRGGHHFDVMIDAENTARPTWSDVGPCVLGPSSGCDMARFLAPVDPGPGATPGTPPDTPAPAVDLAPIVARLEALERAVQALNATVPAVEQHVADARAVADDVAAKVDPLAAQLAALADQVAAIAGRPIPVACSAALNLGATRIPISCRLQ